MTQFGITEAKEKILISIFAKHLKQGRIIVYGSRAKGNFTPQSDLDLTIQAAGTTDQNLLAEIQDDIEESDFPYLCGIHYFEAIKSPSLIDHIERVGVLFYERKETDGSKGVTMGWEIKTLGEVCDFYRGLTYSKKDEVKISKNAVLRATNIDLKTHELNLEEIRYISDKILIKNEKKST